LLCLAKELARLFRQTHAFVFSFSFNFQ